MNDSKKIEDLSAGTKIVLTKRRSKPGAEFECGIKSAYNIGDIISGTLTEDVEIGKPICLNEYEGKEVTGNVKIGCKDFNVKDTIIIIETEKSVYYARVVTDEDEEFKKFSAY